MSEVFVNKVAESGILTLDLEQFVPREEVAVFDMKDYLFMGLILKEKDFRAALQELDLTPFKDKYAAVTCSADAIIPVWAYMLITAYLEPVAREVFFGTEEETKKTLLMRGIAGIQEEEYLDKRVVVKGCGDVEIGPFAYLEATKKLRPIAKSIMYGEPCSTVPIFKKKPGA